MLPIIPRKNSRLWRTIIYIINNSEERWLDNMGEGHQEFTDDVSRLRDKGWPIDVKTNDDGFSKSYRLNQDKWKEVQGGMVRFW